MRRVTRNGVIAAAVASGAMAVTTVPAYADARADGSAAGSPGLLSGNTVQVPVHVPVNVCGNTVNVAGLLNPAAGNTCANEDGAGNRAEVSSEAPGAAASDTGDEPAARALSGNRVYLPVHAPVNVSGNSVNVVGVGNAAEDNESVNTPGERPGSPSRPARPAPEPPSTRPEPRPGPHAPAPTETSLAHTGADHILPAAAGSAALFLAGAALYRRFTPRREH